MKKKIILALTLAVLLMVMTVPVLAADGSAGEEVTVPPVAVCLGIGFVVGLLIVGIMAGCMRSVRSQHSAGNYIRPGSMHLTCSTDRFLYFTTRRTPKPQNKSK